MNRHTKSGYLNTVILCCVCLVILTACRGKVQHHRIATVTILPQKYLVEKIAGTFLEVNVMVPPGMNPATCDLNTGQLKKLYDSDICFTIGHLPFEETHLYPALQNRSRIQVVNHSEGLKLLNGSCNHTTHQGHHHSGTDPHIWLSPTHFRQMATQVYQVLTARYPEQKEKFTENYKKLSASIDSIAHQAEELFRDRPQHRFLIYHPALTYFAADYGLEQISIEDEGKEPNPSHLKEIIDLAREQDIRFIFIQNQFDMDNATAIAREINAQVIPIDPLAENWQEEMEKLIGIFKTMQSENHD